MNDTIKIAGVPPKHASINEALAAAQSEMGRALRQSENPHFKKTYADLASVMDACVPALNRHGVAVIQPPGEDETGRDFVETILLHTSGEKLCCKIYLIVDQNNMQRYGSAVTYARRYGLMCMAGIAPEDDDANAAVSSPPAKARPEPPPTADQIAEAQAFLTGSQTLRELAAEWKGLPKQIQAVPLVRQTKDDRKAQLQPPTDGLQELLNDKVPY